MSRRHLNFLLLAFLLATTSSFTLSTNQLKKPFRPGKDIALFFAVSNYDQWPDLQNPIKDAEAIAGDLKKYYGFDTLVVRNPTYEQVIETLNRYSGSRTYADDGQLFIFFTGHGLLNGGKEGFFVPKDGRKTDPSQQTYLPHNRIAYIINNIPCKHILLGIDACYSGSFMRTIRQKGKPGDRPGQSEATKKDAFIKDMLQFKSRLVITSGGEEPTNDNSAFARQILTALRSRGGESGIIDFYSLVGYLQSARPVPRFGEFGDNEPGGQFLLVYDAPALPADPDAAAWASTQRQATLDAYAYYLEAYPTGRYRAQATEERSWLLAVRQNSPAAYQIYLDTYPDGRHRSDAQPKVAPSPTTDDRTDRMALIPAGTFQMGGGSIYENPIHALIISPFYLSKYEVTVAEFRAFIEASGYQTDAEKEGKSWSHDGKQWKEIAGRNWRYDPEGKTASDNHPVINVSWNDAQAYAQWLSQTTGQAYRLPTEAEWEYAAGNGQRHTKYSWGDNPPSGEKGGNVADETGKKSFSTRAIFDGYTDGFVFTAPVGSFDSNDFGLFDMSGNVWEWCSDWYDADYYKNSPFKNPTGAASGSDHVIRGGSWIFDPPDCRVAFRNYAAPGFRSSGVGFRLARTK